MRDIGEARLQMDDVLSGTREGAGATREPAPVTARRVAWLPIVVALASVALVAGLATWIMMRPGPQPPTLASRFAIVSPPAPPLDVSPFYRDFALSPDGRYLVFRSGGQANGGPLMLRAIDQLDAQPLAGITNARNPFFSSDSRWVGFVDGVQLKKVSVTGGPAITICGLSEGPRGASWGDDRRSAIRNRTFGRGISRGKG